jgi:hypothetical protein
MMRARLIVGVVALVGCLAVVRPLAAQGQQSAPRAAGTIPSQQSGMQEQSATQRPDDAQEHEQGESRITDEAIPLLVEGALNRPKPILELGPPFLGSGHIPQGFTVPGGAVWQPSFLLFGTYRSGISVTDDDELTTTQWANRLDLFGNLYLTQTERVVFGLRPMDQTVDGVRRFSGYTRLSPDPLDAGGWDDEFNLDWDTLTHFFFEGDFQELFPNLDREDHHALDLGFSVGRQPINFQEGLLINDFIDSVGITRNNLKPRGTVNLRITGLWAWGGINRNTPTTPLVTRNLEGERSWLVGLFTETDFRSTTMAIDALYVKGGDFVAPAASLPAASQPDNTLPGTTTIAVPATDGVYAGVSFVQRISTINTAIRVVGSIPVGGRTPADNALEIGDPAAGGAVIFSENSWTPRHGHNLFYVNGFWAIDQYRAAALDPTIPGPLARTGILFAGVGLGNYGAALSPTADNAAGTVFGHQMLFAHGRQQLLVEGGGRFSTLACADDEPGCSPQSGAFGARYQIAVGRRNVLVFDGYVAYDRLRGDRTQDSRVRTGSRFELLLKF